MKQTTPTPKPTTVDEYIAQAPEEHRELLAKVRAVIREAAPDAEEKLSYQVPSYHQNGPLVYFSLAKNHLGFYPTSAGITAFQKEFAPFKQGKGTVQFALDQPIPFDLVRKVVLQRLQANGVMPK